MDRSRVAIVIPAFNEEKAISKVVEGANRYGQSIVIDGGLSIQVPVILPGK